MKVTVIGTGYVGLVTGACLAHFGLDVTCADVDRVKIESLNGGRIPIYEPGLEEVVSRNAKAGRLRFTDDVASAVPDAEVIFLAVGTPPLPDGSADMRYVFDAVETISAHHRRYQVIVTKSTVPVGTGAKIESLLAESHPLDSFAVVSNPEFLREGSAVQDFMKPERIVVGCDDPKALDIMRRLYKPQTDQNIQLLVTSRVTAELIKYASNAFLAVKISFINEVSRLCEEVGADVMDVARGMGMDSRIGPRFLHPGPGYGGSCFPKDTRALLDVARSRRVPLRVVEAAVEANEDQIQRSLNKIQKALGEIGGLEVALLGLAFKSDTDDIRESPALKVAKALLENGARVRAYDPAAGPNAQRELPGLELAGDPYDAASGSDGLVVATEWNEFKKLDWPRLKGCLKRPVVVDLRNLYDPKEVREWGFTYLSVGRP
ncbi:MAG: UDP-glucose dehydrogenase family protein [Acidobacteriota bacterium]